MTTEEFHGLMSKALADRNAELAQVQREYQRKTEAIKLVHALAGGSANGQSDSSPRRTTIKLKPRAMMREAIAQLEEFNNRDIKRWVQDHYKQMIPGVTISLFLNKLKRQGKILLVKEGSGRTGHVYKNVNDKQTE